MAAKLVPFDSQLQVFLAGELAVLERLSFQDRQFCS